MILYRSRLFTSPRSSLHHFFCFLSSPFFYFVSVGKIQVQQFASAVSSSTLLVSQSRRSLKVLGDWLLSISPKTNILSIEPESRPPVPIAALDESTLIPPSVSSVPGGATVKRSDLVPREPLVAIDTDDDKKFTEKIHDKIYKELTKPATKKGVATRTVVPSMAEHYNELVGLKFKNTSCGSYSPLVDEPFTPTGPTLSFIAPSEHIKVPSYKLFAITSIIYSIFLV